MGGREEIWGNFMKKNSKDFNNLSEEDQVKLQEHFAKSFSGMQTRQILVLGIPLIISIIIVWSLVAFGVI